jgi:hypothetical protein
MLVNFQATFHNRSRFQIMYQHSLRLQVDAGRLVIGEWHDDKHDDVVVYRISLES